MRKLSGLPRSNAYDPVTLCECADMDDGVQISKIEVPDAGGEDAQVEAILDSVALARILEEVRNDEPCDAQAYNRMHNRHNR